jgi:ATP-dependent RNA helicase DDX51/DBP6
LSATLSQDPEKLNKLGLFRPILFTSVVVDFEIDKDLNLDEHCNNITSHYGNPSELTERIVQSSSQYKPLALYQLLTKDKVIAKTLVFTNSSEAAHRLAILLQSLLKSKNVSVGELSAQLGSKQREETLDKFIQDTFRM